MSMEFIEDTDPRISRRRFEAEAQALRDRPGEWAVLQEDAPSRWAAKHVSMGELAAFAPAGSYQGRARTGTDGRITIYARYIGE